MKGRPWKTTEDEYVRRAYSTVMSADEIGGHIDRTGHSVRKYAESINIKRAPDWQAKRFAYLRSLGRAK